MRGADYRLSVKLGRTKYDRSTYNSGNVCSRESTAGQCQEQTPIVAIIMGCLLSLIEQYGAPIVPLTSVIMASRAYGQPCIIIAIAGMMMAAALHR